MTSNGKDLSSDYYPVTIGEVEKGTGKLRLYLPREVIEQMNLKAGQIVAMVIETEDGEKVAKFKVMKNPFPRRSSGK